MPELVPSDIAESEKLRRICVETFDRSRMTYAPYFNALQRRYDLYRNKYRLKGAPHWNDVGVPLLFSVVQSDVARKMQVLFGGLPTLGFIPTGPEDSAKALRVERLIDIQLANARTYEKGARFLLNADLYGVSMWKHAWDGVKVAPTWDFIDQTNFFPWPGMIEIEDMVGVVHRFHKEFDSVVADAEAGVYDKAAVSDLGGASPMAEERSNRVDPASGVSEPLEANPHYSKPVEIIEYWGKVPNGSAVKREDGTPTLDVIITVANRRVLLRAIANPHGKKPFGRYAPFEDPHYFYAPGKVEIGEKLQAAVNRLANTKLDVLDLNIAPPTLYNENSGFNPRKMFSGPGVYMGVNGPVDETQIRQISPDMRGVQSVFTELEQMWRWMQQSTGIIEDVSQGIGASDRQTAREFVGRQEAVSTRLALEARLAEVQWLEPLGNAFVGMDRKFLPLPMQVKLIGAHATWDPIAERFIAPEPLNVSAEDLMEDRDVRATGATRTISKQARVMNQQAALPLLAANPQVAAAINWRVFVRQFLHLLDIPNVDSMMNTEEQMLQSMQTHMAINAKPSASGAPQLGFMEQLAPLVGALGG